MNVEIVRTIEKDLMKKDLPNFAAGDTIAVHTIIRDGDKKRTQIFKGIVLYTKGSGLGKTFAVRKISFSVGVEKIFPLHSPNISKIEIIKKGKVRRSKLFYMRGRIGKSAMKIKTAENANQEIPKKLAKKTTSKKTKKES
jgi:large subunit ribosomal protein L19